MNNLEALYAIQRAQVEAIIGVYNEHFKKDGCNVFHRLYFGKDDKGVTVSAVWNQTDESPRSTTCFVVYDPETRRRWVFRQHYNFNVALNVEIVHQEESPRADTVFTTLTEFDRVASIELECALGYLAESLAEWIEDYDITPDSIH